MPGIYRRVEVSLSALQKDRANSTAAKDVTLARANDLVETGCAPLRRLQPALVSTELLRYNVVLTVGSGHVGVNKHRKSA